MPESIITWLQHSDWWKLVLVFLAENFAILGIVVVVGNWIASRLGSNRVALPPEPLTTIEVVVVVVNVILNTATTVAGLWLWRHGVIRFRADIGVLAFADILVLLIVMDLLMYVLH